MTTGSVHVPAPGAPAARYSAAQLAALLEQPPPTAEQTSVIEAPLAPMLVVAGAGSGKTETMASRVVWLIANGIVEPRQVLGLTFTRKAAHELGERIGARLATLAAALRGAGEELPPGLERGGDELVGQRPLVHTYNGFALDLVREHALAVGIDPELTMMSASASWQLAHEIVEGWDDSLDLDASPATLTAALLSLSSSLADHLVTPDQLEAHLREIRDHLAQIPLQVEGRRRTTPKEVAKVIGALESRLALIPLLERFAEIRTADSALDFSDQVSLAARIARDVPAAATLARRMHRVVLLDEFQDTSVAQLRMLTDLFGPGHAACAVGDPQQAIYGWRGASAASLAGFADAFATEEQPVLQRTLSTSWRNDEAVLAVANRVAAPLRAAGAGIEIPELHPRPGAGEGACEILEAADERAEARAIADWILARRAEDGRDAGDGAGPADAPPASAAVLVRARRQIPALVAGLEERGLPAQVVGLGGLLHRPEVADVRALLECAHDPGRGDALMRLLTGPRIRLGARDLAVLGRWRDRMGSRRRAGGTGAVGGTRPRISLATRDDLRRRMDRPGRPSPPSAGAAATSADAARDAGCPAALPDLVTAAIRVSRWTCAAGDRPGTARSPTRGFAAAPEARPPRRPGGDLTCWRSGRGGRLPTAAPSRPTPRDHDDALGQGPESPRRGRRLTEGSCPPTTRLRGNRSLAGCVPDGWLGKLAGAGAHRRAATRTPSRSPAEPTQVDAEGHRGRPLRTGRGGVGRGPAADVRRGHRARRRPR